MGNLYNLCKVKFGENMFTVLYDEALYLRVMNHIIHNPKDTEVVVDGEITITGIIHCLDIESKDNTIQFLVKEYSILGYGGKKQTLEVSDTIIATVEPQDESLSVAFGISLEEATALNAVNKWANQK